MSIIISFLFILPFLPVLLGFVRLKKIDASNKQKIVLLYYLRQVHIFLFYRLRST